MLILGFILGLLAGLAIAGAAGRVLYQRLVVARERARQAERLAELGTLTGGLAHEIRNPLSTIQLNLQLLQEDLASDRQTSPRVLNRMSTVTREALRLRTILDDFLRYAGRIELQAEAVDLNELLTEVVDFINPQAQQSRVQLRQTPSAHPVMATVDARLIKQAILNLMLNAMQVMPGGGELMVSATESDGEARLTVTDTGPGISADDQARVFDAYFSKRKGGTGLGLAMTRRIAQEHGGRMELKSEVGKGSSFSIVIPTRATLPA
ncbi:MAG: sensor histidine kinase [Tepidisphaeraceae bacterium]